MRLKGLDSPMPSVDGLITFQKGVLLGVYVADCCAVYIADKYSRAVALVHSGKKGSQMGIVKKALLMLRESWCRFRGRSGSTQSMH